MLWEKVRNVFGSFLLPGPSSLYGSLWGICCIPAIPNDLLRAGISASQLGIWAGWCKNLLNAFSPSAVGLEEPTKPRDSAVEKAVPLWTPLSLMEPYWLTPPKECAWSEMWVVFCFPYYPENWVFYIPVSLEMCKFVESFWWHKEQQGHNLAVQNFEQEGEKLRALIFLSG